MGDVSGSSIAVGNCAQGRPTAGGEGGFLGEFPLRGIQRHFAVGGTARWNFDGQLPEGITPLADHCDLITIIDGNDATRERHLYDTIDSFCAIRPNDLILADDHPRIAIYYLAV